MSYNYFRDYDPGIGRYLESDPLGMDAGNDTYGYAILSPLIESDAMGLLPDGCLSCIVYGEAGGTNDDCQQAVASVVKNRMGDGKHFGGQNTPCLVASAPRQFDAFGTSRYKRCLTGCPTMSPMERYAADRAFFNATAPDNTNNSVFFHDKSIRTPGHLVRRIKSGEIREYRVSACQSFRFYRFVR